MTTQDEVLAARLLTWLQVAHEAVWTYPVIAARVAARESAGRTAHRRHRVVRDALVDRLVALGVDAPAGLAAYPVPAVESADDADPVAQLLERRATAAALGAVGASEGRLRAWCLDELQASAEASIRWGDSPTALPGLH